MKTLKTFIIAITMLISFNAEAQRGETLVESLIIMSDESTDNNLSSKDRELLMYRVKKNIMVNSTKTEEIELDVINQMKLYKLEKCISNITRKATVTIKLLKDKKPLLGICKFKKFTYYITDISKEGVVSAEMMNGEKILYSINIEKHITRIEFIYNNHSLITFYGF